MTFENRDDKELTLVYQNVLPVTPGEHWNLSSVLPTRVYEVKKKTRVVLAYMMGV